MIKSCLTLGALALAFSSQVALATVFLGATGASNSITPLGQTIPVYYFSNISTNTAPDPSGNGVTYNIETAAGTGCSKVLNPNCRDITGNGDGLVVSASSTSANPNNGQMYLVVSDHLYAQGTPPAGDTGEPLTAGPGTLAQIPYPTGSTTLPFPIQTFQTVCTKALANVTSRGGAINLTNNCVVTSTLPHPALQLYVNVILNLANNGSFSGQDEVAAFPLFIQSTIPQFSDLATTFGFYGFITFPGDSEVHLKGSPLPTFDLNYPTSENAIGIQKVRLYYAAGPAAFTPTTFTNISPQNNSAFFETNVADTFGNLTSYYVTNLTNGTNYYFRGAMVDNAGNIGFLTKDDATNDLQSHTATPDQILGLISKNGQCFVATAAFGSPMASQVKMLREFRDVFLMKSAIGRNFISWYYRHSPQWAERIKGNENARQTVRYFLYPAVAFSWVALNWGGANACLILAMVFLMPLLIFRWRRT